MPRRRHRVVSSPELDETPTPQPRTNVQASTLQDGELFNLDDASGSSGSDSDASSTQGGKNVINDPDDGPTPRTAGADIRYFFDKSGDSTVCKECR